MVRSLSDGVPLVPGRKIAPVSTVASSTRGSSAPWKGLSGAHRVTVRPWELLAGKGGAGAAATGDAGTMREARAIRTVIVSAAARRLVEGRFRRRADELTSAREGRWRCMDP